MHCAIAMHPLAVFSLALCFFFSEFARRTSFDLKVRRSKAKAFFLPPASRMEVAAKPPMI